MTVQLNDGTGPHVAALHETAAEEINGCAATAPAGVDAGLGTGWDPAPADYPAEHGDGAD